jgi:hypothetical protein
MVKRDVFYALLKEEPASIRLFPPENSEALL